MIHRKLIEPASITVVGASDDIQKPGGKALFNVISGSFSGPIYPVNPRATKVQGLRAYADVGDLPQVDLAILAIPAKACVEAIRVLATEKETRAFIVFSAGFGEESKEGAVLEREMVRIVEEAGGSLIGPNCIGVLTPHYNGVFTTPIPRLDSAGCDFISGSGATAVFIMESAMDKGVTFSRVFSVGNSAQIGVEEVLEYLDEMWEPGAKADGPGVGTSPVPNPKLLYIESIKKPEKLLKHARSLTDKGCRIAAVKAGTSSAGSRAASSHTGALAGSDAAVDALFRKAGIIRCFGREELTTMAGILSLPRLNGKRIAVITHAGGPAVMLTDALSEGGFEIPPIEGPKAQELKDLLFPGSSTANPIDFLATGTAEQLGTIIDYCDREFDQIDAMVVIFGSPGLFPVHDAYEVLHEKMRTARKPIYPVLPSVVNAAEEIAAFSARGNVAFPDEVTFGQGLAKSVSAVKASGGEKRPINGTPVDLTLIRSVVDSADAGYLSAEFVQQLLDGAGIRRVEERITDTVEEAVGIGEMLGYPLVMKVVGPLHKSDVGGVIVGVEDEDRLRREYARIMRIPDVTAVLLQPMLSGMELFAGAKAEEGYGHLILFGLGGIFVEVLKDVQYGLTPLGVGEAQGMIRSLRGYGLIEGVRGQAGADEDEIIDVLRRLSALVEAAPEIEEMDLNPLIVTPAGIVAVDARIRVELRK